MGAKVVITELDQYLFGQGTHYDIYKKLGAHFSKVGRREGVHFAVWAPNAQSVSVVGEFNNWNVEANPMKKIGWILEEPLKVHGMKDKVKRKELVSQMLTQVGLDPSYADRYPNELSGGQRQRISIGGALILNSKFIVADEPVSALDVTVQSQVLNLLLDLHRTHQLTYLFISHDLNIVRHFCNRVIVMYLGEIVEEAEVEEIYEDPKHPYTQLLFHSILTDERKLQKITDVEQSREDASANGCPFYHRCMSRSDLCREKRPERTNLNPEGENPHWVKCFKYQS